MGISCEFQWRMVTVVMIMLGALNLYAMRANISTAMVCMVNHTAVGILADASAISGVAANFSLDGNSTFTGAQYQSPKANPCGDLTGNVTKPKRIDGEFIWPKETQGLILSSFFWGYAATQFPAGLLSQRFGSKTVISLSQGLSCLLVYLTPACAAWSYWALVANRIGQGLAQGLYFPAFFVMLGKWSPPHERSRLSSYSVSGIFIGSIVVNPVSALFCRYVGWESIFYFFAALTTVWFFVWIVLSSDSPATHKYITELERTHILSTLQGHDSMPGLSQVPWRAILTSSVFWATAAGLVGYTWGNYLLLTNLPTFYREVFNMDITSNGIYASLPYVASVLFGWAFGHLADFLILRKHLRTVNVRRLMHFFGIILPAALFLAASHVECSVGAGIALITLGQGFTGAVMSSVCVSLVEIAPRYSDIVMGLVNTLASLCGVAAPALVGYITPHQTAAEWQTVFYIGFGFQTVAACIYMAFIEAEAQPWSLTGVAPTDAPEYRELDQLDTRRDTADDGIGKLRLPTGEDDDWDSMQPMAEKTEKNGAISI